MAAQEDFINRLLTLNKSLSLDALTDWPPVEKEHNDIAEILRNGLAVVGFTALEDFIKRRTSEVLSDIGKVNIPFNKLPKKIQSATTYDSIKAISFQLDLLDESQKLTYIIDQAFNIASTQNPSYTLIEHAYGYSQSNINAETIKTILTNFQIDNPWLQMTRLASRLNLTALPLEETYKNAFRRRHKAAHVAHASTLPSELRQYIKEAYAVAVSFDTLISHALHKMKLKDVLYLDSSNPKRITDADINFRFIKFENNKWKEFANESSSKAYRSNIDFSDLHTGAKNRAISQIQTLISMDTNGLIKQWDCTV